MYLKLLSTLKSIVYIILSQLRNFDVRKKDMITQVTVFICVEVIEEKKSLICCEK
jgi:hypothetical protein